MMPDFERLTDSLRVHLARDVSARAMGSGSRLKFYRNDELGLGFGVSRFPFAVTIWLHLTFWNVTVGLGKAYDK